jgi:peptidoglycan/LPS O-acetylase OafA/YrhL
VSERGRIPELDGLRGIAIGTILLYHYFYIPLPATPGSVLAYLLTPGRIGWSGVDLFFVLSGFLIGGILLDARESPNYYSAFYARRFFRIIPAYFLLLISYLVLNSLSAVASMRTLATVTDCQLPIAPYFLFLQNFWMGTRNTLGGTTLGITWSLAIEEQFYLTLPLIIRLIPRRRLVWVLLAGIGFAEVLRVGLNFLLPNNYTFISVLMPCRADALFLGVLGAYAFREPTYRIWLERNRRLLGYALSVLALGVAVMVKLLGRVGFGLMPLGGYTWIATFFLCALLYSLLVPASLLSRCLCWKWLRALGVIAYGTYLSHQFILNLLFAALRSGSPRLASPADIVLTLTALLTTLVLCSVSWNYLEKPLVRIGHHWQYHRAGGHGAATVPSPIERADTATT